MKTESYKTQGVLMSRAVLFSALLLFYTNSAISQDAEAIFQKGNSLSWEGNYQEALVYVDSSLNIDSSLYQRYNFRAELKIKLGMIESAIEDVTRCIDKCSCTTRKYHTAKYYLKRADLQLLNKDELAAISDINKSISINSRD